MKCLPRNDTTGLTSLIVDGLDSTLTLMDTSGAAITQYTYEPFGRTTATGTASSNAAQFIGRENDGTGLYYYRARYYNPVLQRFLSEDPLGFNGGDVNLYAYVGNSPTNLIDASGLEGTRGGDDKFFDMTPEQQQKELEQIRNDMKSPDARTASQAKNRLQELTRKIAKRKHGRDKEQKPKKYQKLEEPDPLLLQYVAGLLEAVLLGVLSWIAVIAILAAAGIAVAAA